MSRDRARPPSVEARPAGITAKKTPDGANTEEGTPCPPLPTSASTSTDSPTAISQRSATRSTTLDQGDAPNPPVGEAFGLVCAAYSLLTTAADISRNAYELDDELHSLAYVTSLIFGKPTKSLDADSIRGAIRAIANE